MSLERVRAKRDWRYCGFHVQDPFQRHVKRSMLGAPAVDEFRHADQCGTGTREFVGSKGYSMYFSA
jgi:hypothetical protein